MLESGLTPGVAIHALAQQQTDPRFVECLGEIDRRIRTGTSLSSAFALYPELFPAEVVILVRSGEEGGDIAGRLRRAAQLLHRGMEVRARILQAVTSPLITAAACGLVLFLVVELVFPKFVGLYDQMDLTFPLISRLVFGAVQFLNHPLTLTLMGASLVAAVIYRRAIRSLLLESLFRLPWMRPMMGKILCASLCETFVFLHQDGVPIQRAFQMIISNTTLDDHRVRLEQSKKLLISTGSLAESMYSIDYFPSFFHHMLVVGEETGGLDKLLSASQRMMEEEMDTLVNTLTAVLEPLVICFMGCIMAVLFVGMFLPIYGILEKLGGG